MRLQAVVLTRKSERFRAAKMDCKSTFDRMSNSNVELSHGTCSGCSVLLLTSTLMVGVLFGILIHRIFIRFASKLEKMKPSPQKTIGINCKEASGYIKVVESCKGFDQIARQKLAWRNQACMQGQISSACDPLAARNMLSLRGTLFANSMRKLNIISGRIHGLIEARGRVI